MLAQFDGHNLTEGERTKQPIKAFLGIMPLNSGRALSAILLSAILTTISLLSLNGSAGSHFLKLRPHGQVVSGNPRGEAGVFSSCASVPVCIYGEPQCWPDLSGSVKLADRYEVAEGEVLAYTILLTNTGSSGVVYVSDRIPTSMSHTAGSAQVIPAVGFITGTVDHLEWTGVVSRDSAVTITFPVTVTSIIPDGESILNTAWISYGGSQISRTASVAVDADCPSLWGCTPLGWVTSTQTPTCTVQARDLNYGLDVGSAVYQYSTDGGTSWNDAWLPADCSGGVGTTLSQTIAATGVLFQQDSGAMNLIKFGISDVVGYTAYHTCTIPIDTTPPTFGRFSPQGIVTTTWTPTCTIVVSDVTSGLNVSSVYYRYSTDGGASWRVWSPADCSGTSGTTLTQIVTAANVPFGQDSVATNRIAFRVSDIAGHTAYTTQTIPIDTVSPTFGHFSPQGVVTTTRAPTCTIAVSDVTSGLDVDSAYYQYSTNGGTSWNGTWLPTNCSGTSGTTLTQMITAANVPFGQDSVVMNQIEFRISDIAGHTVYTTHTVPIDVVFPAFGNFSPQGIVTTTQTPACTIAVSDVTSGLDVNSAHYRYSTDGGMSWNDTWLPAGCSGTSGSTLTQIITAANVPFGQDSMAMNRIEFRVSDIAGHTAYATHTVPIDTVSPTFGRFSPQGVMTTTRTPTCTIVVSDVTSGLNVSSAYYRYSTDRGASWRAWLPADCSGTSGTTLTQIVTAANVPFGQDSVAMNRIEFRVSDIAGHTAYTTQTVPIDTTPPAFGSFSIQGFMTTARPLTCTIEVLDITSGLNVGSAYYRYSEDGGARWSDYITATCTGSYGTRESQLITVTAVPFNSLIQFKISDVAGNLTSSRLYPVPYTIYLPFIVKNYTRPFCNGDFETIADNFAVCWERGGNLSVSITTTLSNGDLCYSGTQHCALLGSPSYPCDNIPLGYGQISQIFGVPPTGTSMLSFRYRIFSYEELDSDKYDALEVYIDDIVPDDMPPIRIWIDGSQDRKYDRDCKGNYLDDMGWKTPPVEFNLAAIPDGNGGTVDYRGKAVQLSFYIYSRELPPRTIGWYNTWAYVDDVRIEP